MTPTRSAFLGASLVALVACSRPKATAPITGQALAVAGDPNLITMTAEPTTTLVAASTASQLGVRVQITARDLPDAQRPALNLGLVLDTSGSMEGDAIVALRDSAKRLVSQMRDGDRVSVIAFHSKVDLLAPSTKVDAAARARITAAIGKIAARGTTDLAAGLAVGLQQVQGNRLPNGINRIVLLSDGVPNTSASLPGLVANAHSVGIGVTTLGLGIDYDSTLLAQMARDTGGNFHYIEKPDQVAAVFDAELSRMSTVVGRNLILTLAPGPGVAIEPMPGLVVAADGRAFATIGDLAAGEQRDLMVPIKVTARGDGTTAELVDAQLSFDDVIGRSGQRQRDAFVAVKTSTDQVALRGAVKIGLEVQRIRTTAASAILEAITLARGNQLDAARMRLSVTAELVRAASSRLQDPELVKIVAQLEEVTKQLAQMVPQAVGVAIDQTSVAPATAPAAIETKLRRVEEDATKSVTGKR